MPSSEVAPALPSRLRALAQVGSGVLARSLSHAATLLVMLVAARVLSPAEFGGYTLGTALVAFGMLFVYAGVYEYLLRADDHALHADAAFSALLALAIGVALALWVGAPWAARAYHSPALAEMLRAFAVIPLAGCLSAWREALFLRDAQRMAQYNAIVIARDLAGLAIGLAALALGAGLHALVLWRLSPALLGLVVWRWALPRAPRLDFDRARWRAVIGYGGGVTGSRLAMFAEANGVDLLLGLLLQPAAVGVYRMASRLVGSIVDLLAQPMAKLAWVQVSQAARHGRGPQQETSRWHRWLLLVAWPALALVGLGAEPLTHALLGERWQAAAPLIGVLALAAMLRSSTFALEPLFATLGQATRMMQLRTANAAIALGAVALAGPWGALAAAWSQVAAAAISVALMVGAARRSVGLELPAWARALRWPTTVVVGMAVSVAAWQVAAQRL